MHTCCLAALCAAFLRTGILAAMFCLWPCATSVPRQPELSDLTVQQCECCVSPDPQALQTAHMAAAGEPPRPPYHVLLDQWLASLGDDADVDDAEMPEQLTAGGIAVTAFYLDAASQAWPLPLARLLGSAPGDLDAQLAAEWQLQPLPSLQVRLPRQLADAARRHGDVPRSDCQSLLVTYAPSCNALDATWGSVDRSTVCINTRVWRRTRRWQTR